MRPFITLPLMLCPLPLLAEPIEIVTDIAPIHSLVSMVAGDAAQVTVLVSGAASPHDFQFSFDEADSVQSADIIIWAGADLTPWLEEALSTIAPDAPQLALLEGDGWPELDRRDWEDDHDHGDHDHGDHDDHAIDPHAWLDPQVAIVWTQLIADALGTADPENAATYRTNQQTAMDTLKALDRDIAATLSTIARAPLLVPHDAYQYFGARYDVLAVGAITLSDAQTPSPNKIAQLQDMVRDQGVACVLSDPQSRREWVDLVREGSGARTALADPMGTAYPVGPDHYVQTLRGIADAYADCLGS